MYGSLPSIRIISVQRSSAERRQLMALRCTALYGACTLLSAISSSVLSEETKAPEPGVVLLLLLLQRALGHCTPACFPRQAQESCQVQT